MNTELVPQSPRSIDELEAIVDRGRRTFVEVGQALMEINDRCLYRARGYVTFESYCWARWGWTERHGYRLIAAAQVVANLKCLDQVTPGSLTMDVCAKVNPGSLTTNDYSAPVSHIPVTERQARILAPLSPADQRLLAGRVDFANITVKELQEEARGILPGSHPLFSMPRVGTAPPTPNERPEPQPQPTSARPTMAVHYSSDSAEWYTPPEIIARVIQTLGMIDLDPCSNGGNCPTVPASQHLTKADDGLVQSWQGRVYMNPPYGRAITDWIAKLIAEYRDGDVTAAIALVPARTDTDWFRLLRDFAICFIDGRLRFSGMDNSAPFPSCVAYLGNDLAAFTRAFADMGDVWLRYRNS